MKSKTYSNNFSMSIQSPVEFVTRKHSGHKSRGTVLFKLKLKWNFVIWGVHLIYAKSYTVFLSDLMKMDVLVTKTTKKKKYLKSLTWFLSLIICTVQYLGNMSEDWEWFHDLALLWLACVDFLGADFRNADSSAALQEGPPIPKQDCRNSFIWKREEWTR